jgi:hypothetical protein
MDRVFPCPWCEEHFVVAENDIRCGIFRHAVFKHNQDPIPPHSSQENVIDWQRQQKLWGCGQPIAWNPHKQQMEKTHWQS